MICVVIDVYGVDSGLGCGRWLIVVAVINVIVGDEGGEGRGGWWTCEK